MTRRTTRTSKTPGPGLTIKRTALILSALAAAALLSGCGGGGGGGGGPTPPSGNVFNDEFDSGSLNTSTWGVYANSQSLQRTRFGFTPQLLREGGTSFARLRFDTYNPDAGGVFKGTEIYTRQRFARGNGLEISGRLRAPGVPPGVVFAFFSIYDRYTGSPANDSNYLKTEIDFEFLGSQQEQFTPLNRRNRLYLNIWDDWNLSYGYDGDDVETPSRLHDDKTYRVASNSGFDWANWNIYTIRWYPDRTEFLLNGVIERTEREVKPNEDMSVHFNIWAATADFSQAYSASLQPTNAAGNRSYFLDVDYLTVRSLGAASMAEVGKAASPPEAPLPPNLKSYRNG